ncbi:MAG: formate/nitrite transporter family protein [Rhodospirillales bacterium]|nr:formate/nitrite transporter family protein [Rhodospirillales bacterium]MDE2319630.1 formate/nitrite transporter family protein [Rhodospirillales bacterium]
MAEDSNFQHLDDDEQRLAKRHTTPRALIIHEIIRDEGEQELQRKPGALALSGLAAGLSMGFSFLTEALLTARLPDTIWRPTLASFGYAVGFIIVVLARQQLFTESTLTALLPLFTRRDRKTLYGTLRLWAVVLAANIAGTWIFAALLHAPGLFPPAVTPALQALAAKAVAGSFASTFVRAFFAGWLIALMVWILPSAQSSRPLIVLLITYVVALAQLSHIIAGSAEAAYSVLSGAATLSGYLGNFFAPTLLGNMAGGIVMVSVLNHGSIATEIGEKLEADSRTG